MRKITPVYGRDFAALYDKQWSSWGLRMWAFLQPVVHKEVPRGKTWLDLCCGTGSLLRLVDRNGFEATGVDFSRHQVRLARQNVPGARLFIQDIRQLSQ